MHPENKPSKKPLTLGRSSVIILCAIVFAGMASMFVLGLSAGRKQGPLLYDYGDMREQFSGIKTALAAKEIADSKKRGKPTNLTEESRTAGAEDLLYNPAVGYSADYTPQVVSNVPQPAAKSLADAISATTAKATAKEKKEPKKTAAEKLLALSSDEPDTDADSLSIWTVQVSAVTDADEAAKLLDRLRKKGYPVWTVMVPRPGRDPIIRVRVGRYGNRPQAEMVRKALSEIAAESFVTRAD